MSGHVEGEREGISIQPMVRSPSDFNALARQVSSPYPHRERNKKDRSGRGKDRHFRFKSDLATKRGCDFRLIRLLSRVEKTATFDKHKRPLLHLVILFLGLLPRIACSVRDHFDVVAVCLLAFGSQPSLSP